MRVEHRMTKDVRCCRADDTLAAAAEQLWERDCGGLPVVDRHGCIRGMLTDRDICMAALFAGKPLADLRVADAMARELSIARPNQALREAEMVMRVSSVRRLPVLDEDLRVVGMLTCNDLVRWVDDGGSAGQTGSDAVHLVRTLASIGRPREARDGGAIGVTHANGSRVAGRPASPGARRSDGVQAAEPRAEDGTPRA